MKGSEIAETGWRRQRGEPSMLEVFRSITVNPGATPWRRFLAFVGPGYLVAVGYMDPGNWATSLAGGAQFGYALLVVALVSNIMAIILQALCARLRAMPPFGSEPSAADAQARDVAVQVDPHLARPWPRASGTGLRKHPATTLEYI